MNFSPSACLSFDLACVSFDERFTREREATIQVPAPKSKKNSTVPAPKHSPEQLMLWLGLDPEEVKAQGLAIDPAIEAMADELLRGEADWLGLDDDED